MNSIGALPEEYAAFEKVQLMLYLGYSLLLLLTIGQVVLYYLYNGNYHPYCKIVMPEKTCKDCKKPIISQLMFISLLFQFFSTQK